MQDFRNLVVWQTSRRLANSVYKHTASFPSGEMFGLVAQMRRASVSICANIAEGCGRRGDLEFRRFLLVAMGSACELECELVIAGDLAFLTPNRREEALTDVREVKKMLVGLIGTLSPS